MQDSDLSFWIRPRALSTQEAKFKIPTLPSKPLTWAGQKKWFPPEKSWALPSAGLGTVGNLGVTQRTPWVNGWLSWVLYQCEVPGEPLRCPLTLESFIPRNPPTQMHITHSGLRLFPPSDMDQRHQRKPNDSTSVLAPKARLTQSLGSSLRLK